MKRYDASFRKEHKGSAHFVKVGVAFEEEKGRISVVLDALPIGWDGRLTLFPRESPADGQQT